METKRRSIAKALSWRVIAMLITALIALIITREWKLAFAIGLGDTTVKIGLYYLHERLWLRSKYGIIEPKDPEYQI